MVRHPNRPHRPHAGQSVDPTLTRKGLLAHPGSLFIGGLALLFFAYVFNLGGLQTYLDGFFSGLDRSVRAHNNEVATMYVAALPYLGVGLGAVVLLLLLSSLGRGAKSVKKRRKLRSREEVSLDDFTEAAAAHGVSRRVAREAYHGLAPHYRKPMCVTLSDRMTTTLQMKPVEVSDLYGNLLLQTDRKRAVGDDGGQIETVLDLLVAVEKGMPRSLSNSQERQRAQGVAGARKKISLGAKIRQSLLRSMVRKPAPVAAGPVVAAPNRERSFIRPARLAKKELEMVGKPAGSGEESPVTG